jgi:hypothetical protein
MGGKGETYVEGELQRKYDEGTERREKGEEERTVVVVVVMVAVVEENI